MTSTKRGERAGGGGYNHFKEFLDVVEGDGGRVSENLDIPHHYFLSYKKEKIEVDKHSQKFVDFCW